MNHPIPLRYAPCPRCEWPRATWWSDNVIDCEDCGIYTLGDGEARELKETQPA